uniref:Uncharacterized protein n=1 Tax=viral metagenome TaxID=1070528 RepID=A0A6C0LES9_9ZZZZ
MFKKGSTKRNAESMSNLLNIYSVCKNIYFVLYTLLFCATFLKTAFHFAQLFLKVAYIPNVE